MNFFLVENSALLEDQVMMFQGFSLNWPTYKKETAYETSNKLASFKSNSSTDQQVYDIVKHLKSLACQTPNFSFNKSSVSCND